MKHKTTAAANKLLLEGQLALVDIENNGVRVDKSYLDEATNKIKGRIKRIQQRMLDSKLHRRWTKTYGEKTNIGSREQLSHMLFDVLKFQSAGKTASKRDRTDKAALETIDHPFVKDFLEVEELKKAKSTYLDGILRALTNDGKHCYVHPSYNLNTTGTHRSSCSDPNFQNVPIRNPKLAEIIRRCYIPRPDRHFAEPDFAQIEVRIAACYNHDPALIRYIKDKSTDMHRDIGTEIFLCKEDELSPEARHAAKNQMVFPQFYGSVYFQCAPHLWDAMVRRKLEVNSVPMRKYMAKKGITELGDCDPQGNPSKNTFVYHLKKVEEKFWKRFNVYANWKKSWYNEYLRTGGFSSLTGFAWNGSFKRNEVNNFVIQCDAFQCLLWSLVRMVRWLRKNKMRTLVVGEIHDSMQLDIHPKELQDVLCILHQIMTEDLPKAWDWIIVPLEIDVGISPINESWFSKEKWKPNSRGIWCAKA